MCVIIIKEKGNKLPSKEMLKTCFNNNPDGAGIMYNGTDNKVHITKGYMNFDKFYQAYNDIAEKNPTATIVAHCRITTQGGVQQELCHPYPLSHNIKDLRSLKCRSDIGVAHNGVIHLTSDYRVSDRNDTMSFIEKYLYNIIQCRDWYKSPKNIRLIKNLIGDSNKLAILDGQGHLELINQFYTDKATGCRFSNKSYETLKTKSYIAPKSSLDFNQWLKTYDYSAENKSNDLYEFDPMTCPVAENPSDDESYVWCDQCTCATCSLSKWFYRTKK